MGHGAARNGVDVRVLGRKDWGRKVWVVAMLAPAALLGCNREVELKHPNAVASTHVSPTPPIVPRLPAGTFDEARARGELLKAQAARLSGDSAGARQAAEAAAADWPADAAAWAELAVDCRATGDDLCGRYADFFQAKVDFVNPLPPRVAVLGFATLAGDTVGTHSGDYVYDQRTLDMAARIASFYDQRDAISAIRIAPKVSPPKP